MTRNTRCHRPWRPICWASPKALGGQVSLLHGGIERIQSRAQGRRFLGVATSQGPGALLARASSLADQVPGYLAPA
ncbi:NIL domain-containing protein [Pseudomonas sp. B21-017]|uniref:NIL domain-containing protein n=1 Tax=Pseudomonas sp. B21-017 TaxID=2895474 RepID=UPI002852EAC8|nr:NIL domain-containing protein [Pseudomonas sp. B21-017]